MINKVHITNFKSISDLTVYCNKLNIIAGANSSGKSTFIQSLLLMQQNNKTNMGLNGEFIKLGNYKDIKNFNLNSQKTSIEIDDSKIVFSDEGIIVNDFLDKGNNSENPNICPTINYLSCERIGPEDIYKKNYHSDVNVGMDGEFAIYVLDKNKDIPLSKELICDNNSFTLGNQVNYWLKYILGATIVTEDIIGTDFVKCFFSVAGEKLIRPKNVGAGFSYLVSIIVMCLLCKENDVVVIENPEIHLHPNAQSKVFEFLYFISSHNRQVFVETHSDHIFNGVRAGIASEKMESETIAINFFTMNDKYCTENNIIKVGKRGRISNCPNGLFDQFDIDLNRMLNI